MSPIKLFHGTDATVDHLRVFPGHFGTGIYLTNDEADAAQYCAFQKPLRVEARIKNPLVVVADYDIAEAHGVESPAFGMVDLLFPGKCASFADMMLTKRMTQAELAHKLTQELRQQGFDGVQMHWLGVPDLIQYLALDSEQVKIVNP